MTRFGTSHFESRHAAWMYYAEQNPDILMTYKRKPARLAIMCIVADKIASGEISIGPPVLKPGETCRVITGEGRYEVLSQ